MLATPTRIGFVIEPYRRPVSRTPSVAQRHGNLARETDDPLETYFSSLADAQTRADGRQDLLSPDRRRFTKRGRSARRLDLRRRHPALPFLPAHWDERAELPG